VKVSLIVAMDENGVIGREGALPWRLPADLRFFRNTTMGHHLVMGRKTWDSIGRALPGRTTVVVSRDRSLAIPGVHVARDLDEAIAKADAAGDDEVFVVGGAQIYAAALPRADRVYLTRVHAEVPGDVVFSAFDPTAWREVAREDHAADDSHAHAFSICTLERA
jgi:dihydrofolate reductase